MPAGNTAREPFWYL